jgi:ElaB/YqjD/DUF883 family membrane-anchored ribosome-binding protein
VLQWLLNKINHPGGLDMTINDLKNDQSKADLYADLQKVKEKACETRDAITQTAYDAKERAHEIFDQSVADLKEKSSDMQENVIAYVQKNPVKTIGFSMLAGILLSQILR